MLWFIATSGNVFLRFLYQYFYQGTVAIPYLGPAYNLFWTSDEATIGFQSYGIF